MSGTNNNNGMVRDCLVAGQNSEGVEFQGTLLKMTRLVAVFEFHNLAAVLRYSESLPEFKIDFNGRTLYSGKAVVRNLMNVGPSAVVCEASLNENSWNMFDLTSPDGHAAGWQVEFQGFMTEWQKCFRIRPEFKAVISDLESLLRALQLWLNRIELELAGFSPASRAEQETRILNDLAKMGADSIDVFVDQFETMVTGLDEDLVAIHQVYMRRQLHPLLLCSPFAQRCYYKPLGYAGDYEMVSMMLRSPFEGPSLFAKIVNAWLWNQSPAAAHRNRIDYLVNQLVKFALARAGGPKPKILTIGCGPAQEIQRFITNHAISSDVDFTLLDFNEETLRNTGAALASLKARHGRATRFQFIKKSVHHLLKDSSRDTLPANSPRYDFIYCAGLFDYLSDQVCQRLMNTFYEMLAPGGLLIATNVSDVMNATRPFRYSMEYMLDWHLIYRDAKGMEKLIPDAADPDDVAIVAENIGVNVFIEVRKPNHA